MRGDMFLWLVANLKQGVIYFIKQALPPNISAGSVSTHFFIITNNLHCFIDPDFDLDLLRDGWSPEANSTDPQDSQDSPFETIVLRDAWTDAFPDSFKKGQ